MVDNNLFSSGARKLLTFKSHIETWRSSKPTIPIAVEIHPTERCNHHCPACQAQYAISLADVRRRAKNGVDLDLKMLESVWETKPAGVILSGNTGDPLLHPELPFLLDRLKDKEIPTVLITNGQNLNAHLSEKILRTCQGVRISLDAHDAQLYTQTHGVKPAHWEIVIANIRGLTHSRKRLGLSEDNCTIGVGYLTNDRTAYGMVAATELARTLKLDYIQFRPFHFSTANVTEELEICSQLETEKFHIYSSDQKYSRMSDADRTYITCHGAWFYTLIDARGDVYMCCHHVGNADALIGSLRETTWPQLMASDARRSRINSFDTSRCLPLCRLDSQNRLLESIRLSGTLPTVSLDPLSEKHAPFL
jgi:wyosine [tRNA(Phe)-imidazoG37] synthetase (radical SAM superfamily)